MQSSSLPLRRPLPVARASILVLAAALVAGALFTAGQAWRLVTGAPWVDGPPVTFTVLVAFSFGGHAHLLAASAWGCCALAVAAAALAGWMAVRSSGNRATVQMSALLVAAAALLLLRVAPEVVARSWGLPRTWESATLAAGWSVAFYLLAGLARFLVLFPSEVDPAGIEPIYLEQRPWARFVGGTGPVLPVQVLACWHRALVRGWAPAAAALLPFATWGLHAPALHAVSQDTWGALLVLGCTVLGGAFVLCGLPWAIASLSHVRRYGNDDERHRVAVLRAAMLALLGSLVAASLIVVVLFALPGLPDAPKGRDMPLGLKVLLVDVLYLSVFPEVAVVVAALAVLRGGVLDARVAFTRTMGWSILGLLVTVLFIVIERFVAALVVRWLGLAADSGALVAGALMALTFMPARRAVRQFVGLVARKYIPLEEAAVGEREVLAIAVVDLSGYTALSARDESQAVLQAAALNRACEQAADDVDGRCVKSLGDGALLVFADCASAAQALAMIEDKFGHTLRTLGIEPLPLHSGLHWGEVVVQDGGDVFGHHVNLAARLADAAAPGQVLASAEARAALPHGTPVTAAGARKFKNVPQPVECFCLA